MSDMLPYEGTPPATDSSAEPKVERMESDDPLDRPLDEYKAEVPDHVKSLMGRMSRGKVYLLEETPAILHVGGEERIRGDPVSHSPECSCLRRRELTGSAHCSSCRPARHAGTHCMARCVPGALKKLS